MPDHQLQPNSRRGLTLIEAAIREQDLTAVLGFEFAEVRAALAAEDELVEESLDKYAGQQLALDILKMAAALVHVMADEFHTSTEAVLRSLRAGVDREFDDRELNAKRPGNRVGHRAACGEIRVTPRGLDPRAA